MRMPRTWAMSSAFVTSTGTGRHRSVGSGATVNTASTRPDRSKRSPMLRCDAGPLGAVTRRDQRSADHSPERTEMQFVRFLCIASTAVHATFEACVIRTDELARAPATFRFTRTGNSTIRA